MYIILMPVERKIARAIGPWAKSVNFLCKLFGDLLYVQSGQKMKNVFRSNVRIQQFSLHS